MLSHPLKLLKTDSSFYLNQMANIITHNKELWDELRHKLQKRQVFTSLGTKEVLYEFLQKRTEGIEKLTNSMDAHVNDSKINLCEKSIKNQEKKRKEHKTLIANLLHQNNLIPEKMHPFQMPLNKHQTQSKSVAIFDSKDIKLGNKLGNGSQSVVYEVKSFSLTPSTSLFIKRNEEWAWINDHGRKFNSIHCNSQCKEQMPRDFSVKLPRQDNKNYKKHVKNLLQESQILSTVKHPNIIKTWTVIHEWISMRF